MIIAFIMERQIHRLIKGVDWAFIYILKEIFIMGLGIKISL
jgi:hypothetical protein